MPCNRNVTGITNFIYHFLVTALWHSHTNKNPVGPHWLLYLTEISQILDWSGTNLTQPDYVQEPTSTGETTNVGCFPVGYRFWSDQKSLLSVHYYMIFLQRSAGEVTNKYPLHAFCLSSIDDRPIKNVRIEIWKPNISFMLGFCRLL